MDDKLQPAIAALKERLNAVDTEFRGQITLTVPAARIVEACHVLRDEYGFDMLIDETAVDYWPQAAPRFNLVYQLYSMKQNVMLTLRTALDGNAPHLRTIESIYPNANWHERELWDMFGITFDGHSDLRRILMPHDWEGFPQRKDYPLGYEEVQFSFDYKEIDLSKPRAKE